MPGPMLLLLCFSGECLWREIIALFSFNVRMFFYIYIIGDAVQRLPWLLLDAINGSLGLNHKKNSFTSLN